MTKTKPLSEIREETESLVPRSGPASGQAQGEIALAEKTKGKGKVKIDQQQLDAAMYKVHSKYAPADEQEAARAPIDPHAWQIDATKIELLQLLGKGSFGTVHRGTYEGKEVAVKIMNWDAGAMSAGEASYYRQKFLREVEIMAGIKHPNITSFVGAWAGGKEFEIPAQNVGWKGTFTFKSATCCVLMEFVSGGSVRNFWINSRRAGRRRLPYNTVIQLALDTARGLAYLHSKKICHRDLKPDNLLLDAEMRVKIADFGESRLEAPSLVDMSLVTGTYGYMAPEVVDGSKKLGYDHKCDVFSFGICVWEMYCCDVPYSDMAGLRARDMAIQVAMEGRRPPIPRLYRDDADLPLRSNLPLLLWLMLMTTPPIAEAVIH
ncbi:hypothetical protein AXG93_1528s1170 [Marchantia polymorpha subsp. ruderalis]|uniref:Protein kinase domain-containing protein n=1 Tax=Marchantia polymorpha subsp. ruderalis TaxID=1480154 RepID=A0A176VU44_MARPO|nr:hypothetical protein AXG93_1528s1170 [Marchantia polymorpha subsp. ruderalis]